MFQSTGKETMLTPTILHFRSSCAARTHCRRHKSFTLNYYSLSSCHSKTNTIPCTLSVTIEMASRDSIKLSSLASLQSRLSPTTTRTILQALPTSQLHAPHHTQLHFFRRVHHVVQQSRSTRHPGRARPCLKSYRCATSSLIRRSCCCRLEAS